MIGLHLQNSPQGWPTAHARLPGNAMLKLVTGVERAREAKAVNPAVKTWYRWVGPQPLPHSNFEQHCRDWLNQFIDGTFRQYAQYIDFIQEYNETLANSQGPEERERWIKLHTTMAKVWHDEYRQEEALQHIRMILCETAIGNDIPWQLGSAGASYDAAIGYHPYVPCRVGKLMRSWNETAMMYAGEYRYDAPRASFRDWSAYYQNVTIYDRRAHLEGREQSDLYKMVETEQDFRASHSFDRDSLAVSPDYVSPHDWQWYSGRWATMDADFRARGIKVDWCFGEGGPVLDQSTDWSGWLDPLGGWKHQDCLGGDIEKYKVVLDYWLQNTMATPAYKEGRILGLQLFTSGAPGSGPPWKRFDLIGDDMMEIAEFSGNYDYTPVDKPPDGPDDDFKAILWQESIERQTIQLNPTAALQSALFADGFVPVQSEFWYEVDGIEYAAQAAEHLGSGSRRVYYAVVPRWNDVRWFSDLELQYWPVDSRNFTQMFGENEDYYRETFGLCCGHNGVDFGVEIGEPVYATATGVVSTVYDDADGYGLHIRMMHGDEFMTLYAHLSRASVYVGQSIVAGSLIGFTGNTGVSTGPHLHYEIRSGDVAVDPMPYLASVNAM